MRVLFTSPIMEHPAVGGPQLRIENSIKALSRICELDVFSRSTMPLSNRLKTGVYLKDYCVEYHDLDSAFGLNQQNKYFTLFEKAFNRLFNSRLAKEASFILDHVHRREIDVLWFGYGNISYQLIRLIKQQRPNLKVVCDTDSVWSRFVLREAPYASGARKQKILKEGSKKEVEEKAWANLCDVTTAVSEVDAEYYRGLTSKTDSVHIFSNVIDVESYKECHSAPQGFSNPSIYLAGSFGHYNSAMDTAARWMLDEVLPLILKINPNVHFYIVGNNSDISFGHINNENITVTGRLETVLPYLCNANVSLVPLKFESGTRFKILEAGACHVPLVSTTLGAEGIDVLDGKHILIADEAEDFANAIVRILDDKGLSETLAKNCHKLVTEFNSVEALKLEAKHILEYLKHD
jgi:glycosyltransferase involved in cell wall biosynthesis